MKKLTIIRGPLGVGKTTISKLLAEKLGAEYLSLDKIMEERKLDQAEGGIPVENFLKANEIAFEMMCASDKSFILDGCFYYQEQIDDLKEKLKDDIQIFSLMSNVETCIERDAKREKVYGEDSARYVHMVTAKVKEGEEIQSDGLSVEETVERILERV